MLSCPFRYCNPIRRISPYVIYNKDILEISTVFGSSRNYSKDDNCKGVPQIEGKKVEPWPKNNLPPPAWRAECPREPQPPNYDPYRIKVPDVVVPPLPPSNAKELLSEDARELFNNPQINFGSPYTNMQSLFHNSAMIHPNYLKEKPRQLPNPDDIREPLRKLGYHGRQKYKYAFHEPWKPLDRLALLEQAEIEDFEKMQIHSNDNTQKQFT